MAAIDERFSPDWATARARFRAATAHLPHGALEVVEGHTIDWAFTGDPDAEDLVVFSSGLHGVEGFAGSAVQLDLLARPDDTPTLWLHTLNPWGMAHLRRVNERNVDLNRNFLAPGQPWRSDDPTFAAVDPVINDPTPPGLDLFWLRAAGIVLRHGYQVLKNAIVGGQHQNPRGLFYAGAELEAGPRAILAFVDARLAGRRRVVHVDLHTGIGPRGGRTLLLEGAPGPGQLERCRAAFGEGVKAWDAQNRDAYEIRGGMLAELGRRLAPTRFDGLTCEFGTSGNLAVLHALREENRLWQWGSEGGRPPPDHPLSRALLETFVPADPAWRAQVLAHGPALRDAARALLRAD